MTDARPHTESELVEHLRSVDVRAPQELHGRIEQLIASRSAGRGAAPSASARPNAALGRRLGAGLALAAALAAVLAVSLSGGSGGGALTLSQASALTLRPATAPAPSVNRHGAGTQLSDAVDGISFPYWGDRFGWRATGARVDRIGGRTVRTVFYGNDRGQRIGYAIVAGTPAPGASGGAVTWRGGARYVLLAEGGLRVVTWLRDGHRCVVAGRDVSGATLLMLASWDDRGATAS